MKINKFTKQKNGMYKIQFEDGSNILAHEDIILKYELLIKKEITEKEEKIILKENIIYEGYDQAIKYITKKMRSKKEIIKYLESKELDKETISEIIKILKKNGYINDEAYAEVYINDRILLSNDGPNKIKKYLLETGVDKNIIEEKIKLFKRNDELEKIEKIVNKMKNANRNKSAYILKNKILDYLNNLGYDKSTVLEVLDNYKFENSDDIVKKEYEKAYKKLSKKYSGKELEYKLKQKMYSLGFYNFDAE